MLSVNAPPPTPAVAIYDPAAALGLSSNPQTEAKPSPGLLLGPPCSAPPPPRPQMLPHPAVPWPWHLLSLGKKDAEETMWRTSLDTVQRKCRLPQFSSSSKGRRFSSSSPSKCRCKTQTLVNLPFDCCCHLSLYTAAAIVNLPGLLTKLLGS